MDEHPDAQSLPEAIAMAALLNAKKLPKRGKMALVTSDYLFFANAVVRKLELSGWRFEKHVRPATDFMPPTPGWTPPEEPSQ